VLRNISAMMALINLVAATVYAQLVVFAKRQLDASDSRVALLYAPGSAGVVLLSLAAGPVRRRLSFSVAALGALLVDGLLTMVLAASPPSSRARSPASVRAGQGGPMPGGMIPADKLLGSAAAVVGGRAPAVAARSPGADHLGHRRPRNSWPASSSRTEGSARVGGRDQVAVPGRRLGDELRAGPGDGWSASLWPC
jgi:hypothetical protein